MLSAGGNWRMGNIDNDQGTINLNGPFTIMPVTDFSLTGGTVFNRSTLTKSNNSAITITSAFDNGDAATSAAVVAMRAEASRWTPLAAPP